MHFAASLFAFELRIFTNGCKILKLRNSRSLKTKRLDLRDYNKSRIFSGDSFGNMENNKIHKNSYRTTAPLFYFFFFVFESPVDDVDSGSGRAFCHDNGFRRKSGHGGTVS